MVSGSRSIACRTRHLARPAVPAHQLPHDLDGVADMEQPPDQRLDPVQRPALVIGEPVRQRPPISSLSSRAHCRGLSFSRDTGPRDFNTSIPPCRQAARHRRTVRSVTLRSLAIAATPSPQANRSAACIRTRSRRCCSAGVYPPHCAYRMHPSYAHPRPLSVIHTVRPRSRNDDHHIPRKDGLYEFSLVSVSPAATGTS